MLKPQTPEARNPKRLKPFETLNTDGNQRESNYPKLSKLQTSFAPRTLNRKNPKTLNPKPRVSTKPQTKKGPKVSQKENMTVASRRSACTKEPGLRVLGFGFSRV